MEKEIKIKSDKKSIVKRFIWFVIFMLIAVISLTYGMNACSQNLKVKKGLKEIELSSIKLSNGHFITPFENEIQLYYYVDENKQHNASQMLSAVTRTYSQIAYTTFQTLHCEYEFSENKSIAYINNHPNQEIVVSKYLFDTLKDAYEKTCLENSHYSVFSGKIKDFWNSMFYSSTKKADPYFNETNKKYLENITLALKEKQDYQLVFNEEKSTITYLLNMENEKLFFEENGHKKCYLKLDLNHLYEAYVMEIMGSYFINLNLTKGFFVSQSGYYYHLKDYWTQDKKVQIALQLFAKESKDKSYQTQKIGSFYLDGSVKGTTFTNYYLREKDGYRYQIEEANIRRYPLYDSSSGYPLTFIRYSRMYSNQDNTSLVDLGMNNLQMMCMPFNESEELAKNLHHYSIIYITDNGLFNDVLDENLKIYTNISTLEIDEKYENSKIEI